MIHSMKLNNEPFTKIKNGTKIIELRLYDEKRKLLNIGDLIEFTNISTQEKITVQIDELYKYKSFDELYRNHDKKDLGYTEDEVADPSDMEKYYSKEEQQMYGVVGIKFHLKNN